MPIERRAVFQLGLLLLAVPAQYFLTKYMESSEKSRNNALQTLMTSAVTIHKKYFTWTSWQKWCLNLVSDFHGKSPDGESDASLAGQEGESVATEVLKYREQKENSYFASSTKPRTLRTNAVKYRIGQVVKHKRWGYRGVIVGWDITTKAPESWLQQNHPKHKPHWRKEPSYSILVDTRDRPDAQTTYVAQENIQVVTNTKVIHPAIDEHFENYDGAQYIPRPWLKSIYPRD